MPVQHVVKQGDTIASIAYGSGLLPDTVWNDSANGELKARRKTPNTLLPGDVVVIPDPRVKQQACATGSRHRFKRKAVPAKLIVQLLEDGEPRANVDYELVVDGVVKQGTTDGDGYVRETISPDARQAILRLPDREEIKLKVGHLDPPDLVSGAQGRLNNLGFNAGPVSGEMNPATEAAIKAFQSDSQLEVTGRLDEATINKLKQRHGE